MRTTIDIDDPILKEVKDLQKTERKSLGRIVSDLLARALRQNQAAKITSTPFRWISKSMGPRVDLSDKDALYAVLDRDVRPKKPKGK
jgi:hypothetical protein